MRKQTLLVECFYNLTERGNSESVYASSEYTEKIVFSFECFNYKLKNDMKFAFLAFLFAMFIMCEVLVNMIVLLSIMFEKNRKRIDLCFMSNAISDLLIGMVIMPFTTIYTLFGYFPLGETTCFIWNILDFTVGTVRNLINI
jgi:hypothetical protein